MILTRLYTMMYSKPKIETPITPGEIFYKQVVEENKLTISFTAALLRTSQTTVSKFINNKYDITEEMSERIATVFGGEPDYWLNIQRQYNEVKGKNDLKDRKSSMMPLPKARRLYSQNSKLNHKL